MPRRHFLSDLKEVENVGLDKIKDLILYEGDCVGFVYAYQYLKSTSSIALKLVSTNIDEYPAGNDYIIFTDDHSLDQLVTDSFERLQSLVARNSLSQALRTISSELGRILAVVQSGQSTDSNLSVPQNLDATSKVETSTDPDDVADTDQDADLDWYESDLCSDDGFGFTDSGGGLAPAAVGVQREEPQVGLSRIRRDLAAAKKAGFRVGVYGDLQDGGIVCIAVRIAKLGISEEAMRAWNLDKTQYLSLLIQFKHGYRPLHLLKDDRVPSEYVTMHVGLCSTYKPTQTAASEAFRGSEIKDSSQPLPNTQDLASASLRPLFIGKSLNDLLRVHFAPVIRFRSLGRSWAAAEKLFNDSRSAMSNSTEDTHDNITPIPEAARQRSLPFIITSDQLRGTHVSKASLPLVAMQFLLRHFVRCTEFCLVCHCPTNDPFEALKPYVCSKPLCLYQFLSYGFGPSVEYEIMTQPYVVDLLVSLCYSQASGYALKEMPLGINLKVPLPHSYTIHSGTALARRIVKDQPVTTINTPKVSFYARWQPRENRLEIESHKDDMTLQGGEWLVIDDRVGNLWHFRVKNVLRRFVYLSNGISPNSPDVNSVKPLPGDQVQLHCFIHDQHFDDLPILFQQQAVLAMLDCLPPISVLQTRLASSGKGHHPALLNDLKEIPPAARDLLRWIMASNRSCIMQVDEIRNTDDHEISDKLCDQSGLTNLEPRVSGMADWIQFRFAQGAPDKEQRFVNSIKNNPVNVQYPTLFAWHGSPIHNWHSIIREGLNFDEIVHGRSSGHGVYMSSHLETSLGYSGNSLHGRGNSGWRNSDLRITSVVSLQEVVNAPASFVSQAPHFVVAQKDWIQTRYLFVKASKTYVAQEDTKLVCEQDPLYQVSGQGRVPIQIPITAISESRRNAQQRASLVGAKRRRVSLNESLPSDSVDNDTISIASLEEDSLWIGPGCGSSDGDPDLTLTGRVLKDHSMPSRTIPIAKGDPDRGVGDDPEPGLDNIKTDFVPGNLDRSNIQILPPPENTLSSTTKALMRIFNEALSAQRRTPLHELGFYIDPAHVQNMYQWIVELHSFDDSLPLAEDLKRAGLTSIVLELRFTDQFPFSPPFVRVVKPRFLPFMQGGGGHVTEGGAICMELLTSSGWSAVSSIESVLLQIKLALSERDPPARLLKVNRGWSSSSVEKDQYDTRCYGVGEAVEAFRRACSKHGWGVPAGFDSFMTRG